MKWVFVILSENWWKIFVSIYVFLEPVATILGGPDLFVDRGSTINLTCTIRFGPEPPGHIFWYHENKVSNLTFKCWNIKPHKYENKPTLLPSPKYERISHLKMFHWNANFIRGRTRVSSISLLFLVKYVWSYINQKKWRLLTGKIAQRSAIFFQFLVKYSASLNKYESLTLEVLIFEVFVVFPVSNIYKTNSHTQNGKRVKCFKQSNCTIDQHLLMALK